MNERDSEAVAAQLVTQGFSLAEAERDADVVLLNTCSVRDAAEQKAIGKMKALAGDAKHRHGKVILGYLGCMAQAKGAALIEQNSAVQLVLGTQKFHRTGEYLQQILKGDKKSVCDTENEADSHSMMREHISLKNAKGGAVSAYISIMQGCNQHCTFCIVPLTRGEERSRSIEDIVEEAHNLAANGIKEVVLLGQIVTSYGRRDIPERDGKSPFVQLLEAVHQVEGIERIRFTAPHPKGYGNDLIDAYRRLPKLCEYAHLPIQSGSNRILKLMHRGYPVDRCLEIISKLRAVNPGMGVSTDLIVGFPGETDQDFEDTLSLIRQAQFDTAFTFKYSPRKDTQAAEMEEHLPQEIKEQRLAILIQTLNEIAARRYEALVGQILEVLVEGPSRKNSARLTGRTRCNKIVLFEGSDRQIGQIIKIRITRAGRYTLYGDPAWINLD